MRCQMTIPALATLALVQFAMYARAADSDLLRAIKYGATAKLTVKIVDDAKQPVEGAKIEARFDAALSASGESKSFVSDTNGMAIVSGRTGKSVYLRATKDGYYGSTTEIGYAGLGLGVRGKNWQPWNMTKEIVLRPIKKPLAVKEARYSQISNFRFGCDDKGGCIMFQPIFNPTPNDTNLEPK